VRLGITCAGLIFDCVPSIGCLVSRRQTLKRIEEKIRALRSTNFNNGCGHAALPSAALNNCATAKFWLVKSFLDEQKILQERPALYHRIRAILTKQAVEPNQIDCF